MIRLSNISNICSHNSDLQYISKKRFSTTVGISRTVIAKHVVWSKIQCFVKHNKAVF